MGRGTCAYIGMSYIIAAAVYVRARVHARACVFQCFLTPPPFIGGSDQKRIKRFPRALSRVRRSGCLAGASSGEKGT